MILESLFYVLLLVSVLKCYFLLQIVAERKCEFPQEPSPVVTFVCQCDSEPLLKLHGRVIIQRVDKMLAKIRFSKKVYHLSCSCLPVMLWSVIS